MKKVCVIVTCALITILASIHHADAAETKINLQGLLAKRIPVLFVFGTDCCPTCSQMKPVVDDVAKAYEGRAIVTSVDLVANRSMLKDFRIRMTPTSVFLAPEGKEFFRQEGSLGRDQIIQVFSKMGLASPSAQSHGPAAASQVKPPQVSPGKSFLSTQPW